MRSFLLTFEMCSVDGISQVSVAESRSLVGMCFRFDSMALCSDACYHCENLIPGTVFCSLLQDTPKRKGVIRNIVPYHMWAYLVTLRVWYSIG